MNQKELIVAISAKSDLTQSAVTKFLKALGEVTTEALAAGKTITLPSVGTLSISDRKERVGRNPSTGESITIPAKRLPKFKASTVLKKAIS